MAVWRQHRWRQRERPVLLGAGNPHLEPGISSHNHPHLPPPPPPPLAPCPIPLTARTDHHRLYGVISYFHAQMSARYCALNAYSLHAALSRYGLPCQFLEGMDTMTVVCIPTDFHTASARVAYSCTEGECPPLPPQAPTCCCCLRYFP